MHKYLMIGGGGHARMIIYSLMSAEVFLGYVDFNSNLAMDPIPYLGDDEAALDILESNKEISPVFGIGLIRNASHRFEIIDKYSRYNNRFSSVVAPTAVIANNVNIGFGTVIGNSAMINNGSEISEFCIVNTGAIIEHEVKIGPNVHIAPGATICGEVSIARNVFVGAGAVITNGIKVSNDVIIGAGTVVTTNIDEPGVYVGVPGRKVKA